MMNNSSPQGWKKCKLGEICCDVSYGYTESASLDPIGPKFLRITDIVPGRVNWETVPYCKISSENHLKYQLQEGDIVIARTGATTGYNYTIKSGDIKHDSVFASYLIRYRVDKKKAAPFFIGHLLTSTVWQGFVEGVLGGSAQPGANAKQFADFEILLPPLSEQRAIAGVLSSLDDKIDLLHRQNKTLEGMAEALWQKMFVEEADPGWKKGKLGDELTITMGQSPPGSTYNEDKQGMVFFQGRAEFDFRFPETRLYCTEPKRFAKRGDTLVSVRAPVGDINMAFEDCCIGRGLAAVRHKRDYISYTFYKVRSLRDEFDSFEQQGTVFGSIGKDDFNNIDTFIPSEKAIGEFEHTAKPMDDKIFTNSIQIRTLSRLRDTLLPKLISGEVKAKI
jgi:type I restriction enzyme S subunit